MASDLPYMPFWPKDWLQSTATLTVEQRDAYHTLLCHAWLEEGLPTDEDELREIGRWTSAAWRRIWSKVGRRFEVRDGRLVHPRMEAERADVRERHDRLSKAGKAGAAGRWGSHRRRNATAYATAQRPDTQPDLDPEVHPPPTPPARREGRRTRATNRALGPADHGDRHEAAVTLLVAALAAEPDLDETGAWRVLHQHETGLHGAAASLLDVARHRVAEGAPA